MAGRGLGVAFRYRLFSSSASSSPSSIASPAAASGVDVQSFLRAIGQGVEVHAEKVGQKAGDLPDFLRLRRGWFKALGIPCKQRKLILRYTEKYRQGLWIPKVNEVNKPKSAA